jgi:hypothetical protein
MPVTLMEASRQTEMREALESLVSAGKIERRHVDPLLGLVQCGFCQHRGWGFGRIRQVDPVFGRFIIDFTTKPGHAMDLAFAAESLKPIPRDHILARKAEDLAGLRQMAALHHLEVIKLVLQSFGGRATVDQIQQAAGPGRDHLRLEEMVGGGATRDEEGRPLRGAAQEDRTGRLRGRRGDLAGPPDAGLSRRGLKARLVVSRRTAQEHRGSDRRPGQLRRGVESLNTEIASHQRTLPALALEAIFMRDDLRQAPAPPWSPEN